MTKTFQVFTILPARAGGTVVGPLTHPRQIQNDSRRLWQLMAYITRTNMGARL